MTALRPPAPISVEEYLESEILSDIKREYLGGEVHAMAVTTNRHNAIATNITSSLGLALRGKPCRPFNSNTKVRVELVDHTRFYYPDAMVVCSQYKDSQHWQDSPTVIVEVLSESTRRTDLTEKREAYLTLPSLKVLVFVELDEAVATVYRRKPSGGFVREGHAGIDAIVPLPEIEATLPLAEVYERIEL